METNLNNKQREAVDHKNGPILIVAGAGTGKTKTLTERITNLVRSGVAPERILAITFTNKAANEMKERVKKNLFSENENSGGHPFIGTFHSLGVKIIKENAQKFGKTKYFTILDDQESLSLIKQSIKDANLDPKQFEPRKIKNIISREKNNLVTINEAKEKADSYIEKIVSSIWEKYERMMEKENSLDFDDLLMKPVLLLKKDSELRNHYQNLWEYVHVDEYQDTNFVQYVLSKMLAEKHQNICVVGDGDQNIYGWRGADVKNILNFENDYENVKVVFLEENYRSTQNILSAANEIIRKNTIRKDKNLFTKNIEGEKITIHESYDEREESYFIALKIQELLNQKISGEEIAVLYRANFQSRIIEEILIQQNIPYQLLGVKFFERKEIKDVFSYLRAAFNPESLSDIKRIINFPARGIGKTTLLKMFSDKTNELPPKMQEKISHFYKILEEIKNYALENKPSNTIKFIIEKTGIEQSLKNSTEDDLERLMNIKELASLATKYDILPFPEGIEKLLEDISLSGEQDSLDEEEKNKGVRLMTVHASKGLEFPYVFISGLEHDLFPHHKDNTFSKKEDSEEERRLFYVALTRAKRKLFLSYADSRTIYGSKQINTPSEFLFDIPEKLIEKDKIKTYPDLLNIDY